MSTEERVTAPFPANFERDLENARVLIEEPPWKDNPQKYRKVAEGIVRRVLTFDPGNEFAKQLLEKTLDTSTPARDLEPGKIRASIEVPLPVPKPRETTVVAPAPPPKVEISIAETPRRPIEPPDFSFVVDGRRARSKDEAGRPPWTVITVAAIGAIAGIALLVTHRGAFTSGHTPKAPIAAPKVAQASAPIAPAPAPKPSASSAPPEEFVAPPAPPAPAAPTAPSPKPAAAPPPPVVAKSNGQPIQPVQAVETGTLAVSSPTTVDIYMGDQLMGSAPTTLVLPAGNQTVEYRHQNIRKVLTHVIKANETTTAKVTFDVIVQINAKPWAQVFIDGAQRQPLGQTPLSDVRIPIGSNLVFENPNFPGKSYRVSGNETQIRVNFP